jgi:hypothetical protein
MKSSRPVAMWTNSPTSYARTLKLEMLKSRLKINIEAQSQHEGEAKDSKMKKKKAKAVKLDNVIVQEYEDILAKVELTRKISLNRAD